MAKSGPTPYVARLILDELFADPRAEPLLELAQNASEFIASLTQHRVDEAPQPQPPEAADARRVLLFGDDEQLNAARIRKRRSELASLCHPDSGGDGAVMASVNAAADRLLAELDGAAR